MKSHERKSASFSIWTFLVKHRRSSTSFLILFTVINGIPFYCSTGQNSGQAHTWLPFLGIKESTGWLIKPQSDLPNELLRFIAEHNIEKEITLKRLGNMQTMCISASIGGGFWEQASGKLLKKHLQTYYPELFLSLEDTQNFNSPSITHPVPTKGWNQINQALQKMGALMPLNNITSRLPSPEENTFLSRPDNTTDINQALRMLLVQKNELNEAAYQTIIFLSQYPLLFRHALEHYLFEDATQLAALQKMIHQKGANINESDLSNINQLKNFFALQWKPELIHHPLFRQAIRILAHYENGINPRDVEVVYKLLKLHLLDYALKLLSNHQTLHALKILYSNGTLDKENITLISFLNANNQLNETVYDLLLDEDACSALKKLADVDAVNPGNIELLAALNEDYLLDVAWKLLKNPAARSILTTLHQQDSLSKKNIKLILRLQELNLVDIAADLFSNAASRKLLAKLCIDEHANTEDLTHQIVAEKAALAERDPGKIYSTATSTFFEAKEEDAGETPVKNNQKYGNK